MAAFDDGIDDLSFNPGWGTLPNTPTVGDGASTVLAVASSAAPVSANVSTPRLDSVTDPANPGG